MSDQRKAGRRTKDEEISLYLEHLGIDRDELEKSREIPLPPELGDDYVPTTYQEMLKLAVPVLWHEYKTSKGIAKINAFKAIQQLAKDNPEGSTDEDEPELDPLIADVIDGIVKLPQGRKKQILERELVRLDQERERIAEVLHAC